MSTGSALHLKSSTDLHRDEKFQNVPLRKKSPSECQLEIEYHSDKESLQLLLLSPYTNTINSYRFHLTSLNLSESDLNIKSKKSNKMVFDNKTNDSLFNESTNVLTTKPKNKHKDKSHKEIRHCDAVNQSSFSKMDRPEGNLKTSFQLKDDSEKYSHKKPHGHKKYHSENADTERELRRDKKLQIVSNEEEDLMSYKRRKKFGVDKATDPVGYTANLIKNSQLCFVLSTGNNPFKADNNNDSVIKVKGALINGKDKRSRKKEDVDVQESNETLGKRPKSDGISFFFKKKKLFSRSPSVKDEEASKLEESNDKSTRRKSKHRDELKSVTTGKEKRKHHSKNRSASADATANAYMDRESVESKSYVGDAFKILKRSKKHNVSLKSEDTKRDKVKSRSERSKKYSRETDGTDKHNRKSDNECDTAWYKIRRKPKTRSNSLSGFEEKKDRDKSKEAKAKERDAKSVTESIKKHHRSKKKRDKSKTNSLCVVTSETQIFSCLSDPEKLFDNIKIRKKVEDKIGSPHGSYHKIKKGSQDKKENEKLAKHQTDTSEKKQRRHHENKQLAELEDIISRGAKEIHDELQHHDHRERHREHHREHGKKSRHKSKHKSKSRDQSKNTKDVVSKSQNKIFEKVASDSNILNKPSTGEYVISNSDYAVILEKIVSGKHSFKELTSAIEENHFFEALKSGSLLTPKQSSNLKEAVEGKKSYSITKNQLEILINYLKNSMEIKMTNSSDIPVSDDKLSEAKLERQEISFSKLNLNPINQFQDRNCWDRLVPKNKRLKRRMPFDQHSIVSDAITAKEKSHYGSRYFQNRTPRNFSYSDYITERSNRSIRSDQKSALGFTVEGVEPPKKLRSDVSCLNLAKSNKDGVEQQKPSSPDSSFVNLTKSTKKPLQISVLSVLEIKPNFAEVFNKSDIKFEYEIGAHPLEDMKEINEEPERESKSMLKKPSSTVEGVTAKALSNVAISRKTSNASGSKLNIIPSAISQNKSRLSISESEKSVDLRGRPSQNGAQIQNSKTKFQVRSSNSLENRRKILQPSSLDGAGSKYSEDNRKALGKYSLLSEKCSLSEPRNSEVLNRDLDKDQLANLGQEVLEMMKKYINLSKNEDCPNMDLSSFGAEFLTNVRTCIHERLKPVKEELDMETKESVLPRTDSKSLNTRPSSTNRKIREDISKCVQNYLDSNSVASLNQEDLSQITSNVTKKVESYINDKKGKPPSQSKVKHSVSSKEGVRARMANYINTINEKRRGQSVTAVRSREHSMDRKSIRRTLSIISRDSSRGSINFKRNINKQVSDKSLNDFSAARGSTSSGLSAISRDDSMSCSMSKKVEDSNEVLPNAVDSDAIMVDRVLPKSDLTNENVEVVDLKCSISSVLLPKITEESPSQNSFALNNTQKVGKQTKPVLKCSSKVTPKPSISSAAKPQQDTKTAGISEPLKRISENKMRRRVSKDELNEKLKIIAQDMSNRVMKALQGTSEDGSLMTGDDASSVGSQLSEVLANNFSAINNMIKAPPKTDLRKPSIVKVAKAKTQVTIEKYGSTASLHPKSESSTLLKTSKVMLNKSIVKKKKKVVDSLSNFSHKGSESRLNLKEADLTPLKSIDASKKLKLQNAETSKVNLNNMQSTENVAMLNELISKNIMNILGKNSQLAVNTPKEKARKKEEGKGSAIKPVENEEDDRKKKIIDKLAAAILDDKIFGNLEPQLSKLLDKQSDKVDSDSSKKVMVKEQTHERQAPVVKKELKKNIPTKLMKPVAEENKNSVEVLESADPKKVLTEKVSKIPRYTRFGTKSTTSHFGTISDAGSNIGSASRPTALPKPLKKTTNTLRTEDPSTNLVNRLPVSPKLSTSKEEAGARPLSTFEKRKLYAANMRAKKFSSKSEAEFTADECTYGKPYEVLYVTGEGPSVDPNCPLSKYIFNEPSTLKNTKKPNCRANKGCEKRSSCTKVKAELSTEVTIAFTPSNNKLNISSNLHKIEQTSEFQIRNNYARRASSVSLYSQESRFSQEICMHCLTPKAALSLVSIPTSNKEKMYSTRSNSLLHIDGSDSSHEMVKKTRFNKKPRRQVFNETHFLGYNKEVLSTFLKTTEGSSSLSIKTSPGELLKSKTDPSIKRIKSCGGFIKVWKKKDLIETQNYEKKGNASKLFSTFEESHSSNHHPETEFKIKKKFNKVRKTILVEVAESSICENLQEKHRKPKKKRNKKCLSVFSFQSSKCEYFQLHKPLVNLTRAIKKQNKVLCAKVNKLKRSRKSKRNLCKCECEGSEVESCYTIFKNFHCSKIPRRYFSNENFQFFRCSSLTDSDTNYSTTSFQNSADMEIPKQKYLHRVPSKNYSVNAESGYETHSTKTVNSIRRFYSAEENILSQFTTGFRNFDAGCSFPVVYTVFPVNVDGKQTKCCGKNFDSSEQLNRKPLSPCAKLRLKQVSSCNKGTSPKPEKVRFKKCVVDSENFYCENQGTENCDCRNCAGKSSKNEVNERPQVLVCRNPKCPKNFKARMKHSDGKKSEDEFSINSCDNSNISQSNTSSRSSNSQFTPIDRQFSSSSTYSCGYSEHPELNMKQSGSIRTGCIPKYIWCKAKSRENSPTKSTCSCGTSYQTFQKEKEQCKEYAQKVRKESRLRKEGRFKQFSDFKEIPLCVLLKSNNECNSKDNCPKYNDRKSDDSPKLKVLDKDYHNKSTTSEISCMRSRCPRNPKAPESSESQNLLNDESRNSISPDLIEISKNLNNLSKESLIDIINGKFQSSLKNILDNSKERISVTSKEVSAEVIKPESSAMLKDTSVQAVAPFADKTDELILPLTEDQDLHEDSIANMVREELEYSINRLPSPGPSPGPSGSLLPRSENIESKVAARNSKKSDTCINSTCQNRKSTSAEPPTQVVEHPKSDVSPKKTPCTLKKTPSGKKDFNCHCLDFQKMPKSTLLKMKEQIDMCLAEENNQNEGKPKISKNPSFPFNKNPVDSKFSANFMQAPLELSNLSKIPFAELSASTPLYGKQFSDVNKVSIQGSSFSNDSSHTLFLESYWGRTENNSGSPEEIAQPLLLPRNIVSENLNSKSTRENFSSPEDIPSKEQSFKTPSKQQMLNNSYLEDARCDSSNKISIPNRLNNTLKELEFINATKQSLEMSSEKLSKQLKTLSIELLLQSTNQEDSNNSPYENVITMKEAIDTTFRHLLHSSKEALDVSSKEAQNQLMQSITELSIKSISDNSLREHIPDVPKRSHKSSKVRSKETSEASLLPKTSSPGGAIKKSKGFLKEGRKRTLKEPPNRSSSEVLTDANDKKTKVSPKKSITSISSRCSQDTNVLQKVVSVQESVFMDSIDLSRVEENSQTSNLTIQVTKESSTDPMNPSMYTNYSKRVDTESNEVHEIVNFHIAQVMNFEKLTNENSATTSSNQLSSEILTSDLSSEETVQEKFQNFKDSLSSLMDLIEIKSDELLNMSQESLVVSLDEITMMSESNLSSKDLSKKLGVLFKTSLVKLLDMKSDYLNELVLQETFRNTVQVLLNEIFDEATNQVLRSDLVAKTEKHLNLGLYRDMLCDFMKESDENPFEKPIDTISKVAIVMLVQNISSSKPKCRNKAIPDELLLEMAQVSLQAIIELYQKMYSKKQVNVSFKVMVEDMCRNQSLNKKMKRRLTGSQLDIINILNKKYVSESNTKNYKNCLCSPIKDTSLTTPAAARKNEKISRINSSKFTVKITEPDYRAMEELTAKEEVGMAGSSKFSVKDEKLYQPKSLHELEKFGKQLKDEGEVGMAGSSKFSKSDEELYQQNTVDELEQLTNEGDLSLMNSLKFTLENQQPSQESNVQALEKLREQLTDKEMFEKLLDSYENEEKIVDRLSKDDLFFQSQLELVKSKESVESMLGNARKEKSSSDILYKTLSDSLTDNFSKDFSPDLSNGTSLTQSKMKLKEPELGKEKLLYKYDFDEMVSTYEDSQTSKKSNSIASKAESVKTSKNNSKSRLSGIKAKVGNIFRRESAVKEIVAPRRESNRTSLNESYLSKTKISKEINDEEQKVKFGNSKQDSRKKSFTSDDNFGINNLVKKSKGSISSIGSNKINPAELGKCFLRGFRPDNITLSGDTCLKISNEQQEEKELRSQVYKSPSISFSERETPLDFLLALGFSIDEASNAIKDEDVKNRLLAAITEARIWINKITAVQGTLLYLIAYKANPKIMRYFLQLVEAIINKRINDAVKMDAFLRVLEKVEDGDLAMIAILGSEKFADDENDEKMVKKQLRQIFITVYTIAERESQARKKPLSPNAINLLRILAAKYRAGLHPHLELIAKYIGQDLLRSEVQLEAAMIYLARLDTAYVNLEEFEEYIAIKCPNKK